jgi:hypothetical protein
MKLNFERFIPAAAGQAPVKPHIGIAQNSGMSRQGGHDSWLYKVVYDK